MRPVRLTISSLLLAFALAAGLAASAVVLPVVALGAPAWTWQNPKPQGNELSAVDFIDANTGWAVGSTGTILHTTDGGTTWTPQVSNTSWDIDAVDFTDANNGWAAGYFDPELTQAGLGFILHTSDGGLTWQFQAPGTTNPIWGIHFTDANTGWAVGRSGTIVHTSDGGATWVGQSSGTGDDLFSVDFTDASNGWAVGGNEVGTPSAVHGTILHTTDGGATWTAQPGAGALPLYSVGFNSSSVGWAVGAGGTILHTTSSGSTWTRQVSNTTDFLEAVQFADNNNGWAIGGNEDSDTGDHGTIVHTTDGGTTWTPQTIGGAWLEGVRFSGGTGWAVGEEGTILRTTDGTAWTSQTSGPTYDLNAVRFTDSSTGWAVGGDLNPVTNVSHGVILHTADGASWTTESSTTVGTLSALDFPSATSGWAVGGDQDDDDVGATHGTILHTPDGGATWTSQYAGNLELATVAFPDTSNGWAAGFNGADWTPAILHTSNGGATWSPQTLPSDMTDFGDTPIYVHFTDATHGLLIGTNGTVARTVNGGAAWTLAHEPADNVEWDSASFVDATHGWVCGDDGVILRTTDGGSTWTPQVSGTTGLLDDVFFRDSNNGWIVNEDSEGEVLHTTDGGVTWTPQSSGATNLYALWFTDASTGWGVGDGGSIVHTTNGGGSASHAIYPMADANGTISPSTPQTVASGADSTAFTFTANAGYHLADVKVDGVSVGHPASYTVTNVTADHTIAVTFASDLQPVHRFRNLKNGFYLLSADPNEWNTINTTLSKTWVDEGVAYTVNTANPLNISPLWRFRNLKGGNYLYSADPVEKANIIAKLSKTWFYEGPTYNVDRTFAAGGKTVDRFINRKNGTYLYSADPAEQTTIINTLSKTWKLEGPAFYLAP